MFFKVYLLLVFVFISSECEVLENKTEPYLNWTHANVPLKKMERKVVSMDCYSNLPQEAQYTLRWYKDNKEFYRHTPNSKETFDVEGITVDMDLSNKFLVFLRNLTLASAGVYRCEITSEGSNSVTLSEDHTMDIVPYDGDFWMEFAVDPTSTRIVGGTIKLRCDVEVGNGTHLEAVKWYKDRQLFNTYKPGEIATKYIEGVNIDMARTDMHKVILHPVTLQTSGNYVCEVRTTEREKIVRQIIHLQIEKSNDTNAAPEMNIWVLPRFLFLVTTSVLIVQCF